MPRAVDAVGMAIDTFQGTSTDSVIVIKDPLTAANKAGNHMGYLRSLPYLYEQGITRYTFPHGWLCRLSPETFDEVMEEVRSDDESRFEYRALEAYPFEYVIVDADQSPDEITHQHLCQVTNQETDEYSDARTTHKLLRAYMRGQIEELFLVMDKASFSIADTQSTKPIREELNHAETLSYKKLAKQYIRQEFGRPWLPFGDTLNIWLHHAADEYKESIGTTPSRIADLFEFDNIPRDIRTWDLFEFLATHTTKENIDHINATIRPWLESDITRAESNIRNALQEFDYDRTAVRKFRETGDRPN